MPFSDSMIRMEFEMREKEVWFNFLEEVMNNAPPEDKEEPNEN